MQMRPIEGLRPVSVPFDNTISAPELWPNRVHLLGFEFDGTACFRKGTRLGPNALREVSEGIESYSPYLNFDLTNLPTVMDLGNLPVGEGEDVVSNWSQATEFFFQNFGTEELAEKNIKMLTIGGEHSISYAPIVSYLKNYPNLVLLHLDAHADLRDGYEGYKYSHASIIRRTLDHFGEGHELHQYGIRSGTQEEYEWMRSKGTLKTSLNDLLDIVESYEDDRPIYLTFDLDYFDPSFFPGTGTPEPGGEDFHSFIKLNKILARKNFVGADVVELSPEIDSTGNSSVFAAKIVRELIISLSV